MTCIHISPPRHLIPEPALHTPASMTAGIEQHSPLRAEWAAPQGPVATFDCPRGCREVADQPAYAVSGSLWTGARCTNSATGRPSHGRATVGTNIYPDGPSPLIG